MENLKFQIQLILFTSSDTLRFEDLYRHFYGFGLNASGADINNLINYLNGYDFYLLQNWNKFRILRDVIFYLIRSNIVVQHWVEHLVDQKRCFEKRKKQIFGFTKSLIVTER